jgi:hypothetical protein
VTAPVPAAAPPALRARVKIIADHIFDSPDLSSFQLDDRLRSRSAAVVVLSHAEIEEALENACTEVADALESSPPTGFAFLAWGLAQENKFSARDSVQVKQAKGERALEKMLTAYRSIIKNSHGIRRSNLQNLLGPLGFDLKTLAVEEATLEDFGKLRGESAHLSPLKARIQDAPITIVSRCAAAAEAAEKIIGELALFKARVSSATPGFPTKLSLVERLRLRIGL